MAITGTPYDVGDGIRFIAKFKDINGNLADPTSIAFKLLDPSNSVTTPTVAHTSVGTYHSDYTIPNVPGTWAWHWQGNGAVQVAEEGQFIVRASLFP